MAIAQVDNRIMLAVQKSSGPRCPECGGILQFHNFSKSMQGVFCEDYRLYCVNCQEYIKDPIIEKDSFENIFTQQPF